MDRFAQDSSVKPATLTVADDGQIHVPAELAEWLRAKPGDEVEVTAGEGGLRISKARLPPGALFGMVKVSGPKLTVEEINEAIEEAAVERVMRGLRRSR